MPLARRRQVLKSRGMYLELHSNDNELPLRVHSQDLEASAYEVCRSIHRCYHCHPAQQNDPCTSLMLLPSAHGSVYNCPIVELRSSDIQIIVLENLCYSAG